MASALPGHFRLRHKVEGLPGRTGKDGSYTEDLVVKSKVLPFTVAAAASALGLTPEQLRKAVSVLAKDPKLMSFLAGRVTDTFAHGRDLKDEEPYEPIGPVDLEKLDPAAVKALPYLPD